jgi:hypothetical protein
MNKIRKADIWHGNNFYRGFCLLLAIEYSKITAHWVTRVTKQMILNERLFSPYKMWSVSDILLLVTELLIFDPLFNKAEFLLLYIFLRFELKSVPSLILDFNFTQR